MAGTPYSPSDLSRWPFVAEYNGDGQIETITWTVTEKLSSSTFEVVQTFTYTDGLLTAVSAAERA